MLFRIVFLATGILAAFSAVAQQSYSVEELAIVRDFEAVNFDPQSVRELGGLVRFEVMIRYKDPEQRPPEAPARRLIRYAARCSDAASTVTAVTLIDANGRMLKNIVVPPGGSDYVKPAVNSSEAQWVKRACGK